jgi:L-2-hydroxyglutarate oxidase
MQREGYQKTDFDLRDLSEMLTYPGLWKLARRHWREALAEMHRSLSKNAFVKSLQQLIPEVTADDLVPAKAGIRAQALQPDGTLVNDFLLVPGENAIHVCNAPSPAATASLEIGKAIVAQVPELRTSLVVTSTVSVATA